MFDNLSKVEKKQMRKIRDHLVQNKSSYVEVFSSESGRKVLKDLASRAFVNVTTFDDNPHKMAFNEGRRSIVKHIMNLLDKDVESMMEDLS